MRFPAPGGNPYPPGEGRPPTIPGDPRSLPFPPGPKSWEAGRGPGGCSGLLPGRLWHLSSGWCRSASWQKDPGAPGPASWPAFRRLTGSPSPPSHPGGFRPAASAGRPGPLPSLPRPSAAGRSWRRRPRRAVPFPASCEGSAVVGPGSVRLRSVPFSCSPPFQGNFYCIRGRGSPSGATKNKGKGVSKSL